MRRPIEWHRQCYANVQDSVERQRKEVERAIANLTISEQRLSFYGEQIAAAEKRGMDAFDCERLMIKRSA